MEASEVKESVCKGCRKKGCLYVSNINPTSCCVCLNIQRCTGCSTKREEEVKKTKRVVIKKVDDIYIAMATFPCSCEFCPTAEHEINIGENRHKDNLLELVRDRLL